LPTSDETSTHIEEDLRHWVKKRFRLMVSRVRAWTKLPVAGCSAVAPGSNATFAAELARYRMLQIDCCPSSRLVLFMDCIYSSMSE